MLRDWITYLRTSCSKEARRLGYLHETIGIRERHARHREARSHIYAIARTSSSRRPPNAKELATV